MKTPLFCLYYSCTKHLTIYTHIGMNSVIMLDSNHPAKGKTKKILHCTCSSQVLKRQAQQPLKVLNSTYYLECTG